MESAKPDLAPDLAGALDRGLSEDLFDRLRAATGDAVGITREAYSERESLALEIVEEKARELGLATERDAGANLVVTLEGSEPELPFLACGRSEEHTSELQSLMRIS